MPRLTTTPPATDEAMITTLLEAMVSVGSGALPSPPRLPVQKLVLPHDPQTGSGRHTLLLSVKRSWKKPCKGFMLQEISQRHGAYQEFYLHVYISIDTVPYSS